MKGKIVILSAFLYWLILNPAASQVSDEQIPVDIKDMKDCVFLIETTIDIYGKFSHVSRDTTIFHFTETCCGTAFQFNCQYAVTAQHVIEHKKTLLQLFGGLMVKEDSLLNYGYRWLPERIDSFKVSYRLTDNKGNVYKCTDLYHCSWKGKKYSDQRYLKFLDSITIAPKESFGDSMTLALNNYDKTFDLALLRIFPDRKRSKYFTISAVEKIAKSQTVWSLNASYIRNQADYQINIQSGIIESNAYKFGDFSLPFPKIEMSTKFGDSGSPVVTEDWQLLGITIMMVYPVLSPAYETKRLITPAKTIQGLLRQKKY